jgi:hypothetical protein
MASFDGLKIFKILVEDPIWVKTVSKRRVSEEKVTLSVGEVVNTHSF